MSISTREVERKYETTTRGPRSRGKGDASLPDLTGVAGIASVAPHTERLDAVYYDTEDLRLAGSDATLRHRTGGGDAGWHLKLPLGGDGREEIRSPLSEHVPGELADLVRSRTRGAPLRPVIRIRTERTVRELRDAEGTVLAELSLDRVRARSLTGGSRKAAWTEIELELAAGQPPLLDAVERVLRKGGIRRAEHPSKLVRAARATGHSPPEGSSSAGAVKGSPGAHVVAYVSDQVEHLVRLDPAVRRDEPDAVHRMRVACRRLRSALRSYRSVLDRRATDPVRDELKWLAGELGEERDHEVLRGRLTRALDDVPTQDVLGPVRARLQVWDAAGGEHSRRRSLAALTDPRYDRLLASLHALTTRPPLRRKANAKPGKVMRRAVLKEYGRLRSRTERALALPQDAETAELDRALHEARKAAKKVRYAAEVARPALGKPAKRFGKRVKAVQQVLGGHQDSVVARQLLRDLALRAEASGEPSFTWGLLYGEERRRARARRAELPAAWKRASATKYSKALTT
ncbi:CYTH and CHAD domain-containing protein [Streptomyces sp. NPDC001941]|uniref:CYTH and CHAD domain-containing protein n=1 Tax=Streptomyces sp. NPDC001941 TaxID=3154659 RepID=UPI00331CEA8E